MMKQVLGCIRRADERFNMINPGDNICIGVSGGKDSLLLMYALKLYQRFCKKPYTVRGVMLDLGLVPQDTERISEFARNIDVPFDVVKTNIGDLVFNIRGDKNPCAMCAKLRRGALNNFAVEHGCNLVALGHNREDVIETFFLSLLFESRLNTFGPITYLNRKNIAIIRPLVFLPEKNALSMVRKLDLPVLPANCPIAGKTKREDMKHLISHLSTIVPDADKRIMNAIVDTDKYRMWDNLSLPPDNFRD
ncbi:MAG: tRNA 2-thiocytidine biosynthesis TtcA family protein [Clostridia bacterium]